MTLAGAGEAGVEIASAGGVVAEIVRGEITTETEIVVAERRMGEEKEDVRGSWKNLPS